MARDEKIMLRLDSDVKEKFQKLAESYGMTMSALGAYAIGRLVREDEIKIQMNDKAIDMMVERSIQNGNSMMNDELLHKMMQPLMQQLTQTKEQ